MPMKVKLILLLLCPLICSFTEATKGGYRVRVLRTHEDKVRYLNSSQIAKENFFFGMRPILYVSRYSPCNCPTAAETDTPSPSGSILDLPDFPPEDEVIPPSSSSSHPQTPRIQDNNQGLPHDFLPSYHAVPLPGSSKSKETNKNQEEDASDEEFELLFSNSRVDHQVFDSGNLPSDRPFVLAFRTTPVQRRSRRRRIQRLPRP